MTPIHLFNGVLVRYALLKRECSSRSFLPCLGERKRAWCYCLHRKRNARPEEEKSHSAPAKVGALRTVWKPIHRFYPSSDFPTESHSVANCSCTRDQDKHEHDLQNNRK